VAALERSGPRRSSAGPTSPASDRARAECAGTRRHPTRSTLAGAHYRPASAHGYYENPGTGPLTKHRAPRKTRDAPACCAPDRDGGLGQRPLRPSRGTTREEDRLVKALGIRPHTHPGRPLRCRTLSLRRPARSRRHPTAGRWIGVTHRLGARRRGLGAIARRARRLRLDGLFRLLGPVRRRSARLRASSSAAVASVTSGRRS